MTNYSTYVRDTPGETGLAFYGEIRPDMTDEEVSQLNTALNKAFESKGFTDTSDVGEMNT